MTPKDLHRRLTRGMSIHYARCRIWISRSGWRFFNFGGYMNRAELVAMLRMGIRRYNRITGEMVGRG